MSEPRYDFLCVTIREHNAIGYVLTDLILVYSPIIPQTDRQRRDWCKDRDVLNDLSSALCKQYGKIFTLRADAVISQKILWDVVPLLGIHGTVVKEIKATRNQKFVPLPETFWNGSALRRDWLFDRFKEFHQMGGAQYILKGIKSDEVTRFSR
jgi:hypothetical protein